MFLKNLSNLMQYLLIFFRLIKRTNVISTILCVLFLIKIYMQYKLIFSFLHFQEFSRSLFEQQIALCQILSSTYFIFTFITEHSFTWISPSLPIPLFSSVIHRLHCRPVNAFLPFVLIIWARAIHVFPYLWIFKRNVKHYQGTCQSIFLLRKNSGVI